MIIKSILNKVEFKNNVLYKTSIFKYSNFLNFQNINNVQLFLQKSGYLNNLIESKITNNLLISKWNYIPGKNLKKINFKNLSKIIIKIEQLHNLQIQDVNIEKWDYLNNYLKFSDMNYLEWIKNFNNKYQNLDYCLSHNDLHLQNIIISKHDVYLIDWDFANLNSKYFDYASLIYENNWKLNKYVNFIINNVNLNIQILKEFIIYNHIYWIAWNKYMYKITNNKIFMKYHKKANHMLKYWQKLVL